MLLVGCARAPEGPALGQKPVQVQYGGAEQTLRLLSPASSFIARQPVEISWRCDPCWPLPDVLVLIADMPSMSHGPTTVLLERVEDVYRGSVLFVMGGRWELRLLVGEIELLRGWIEVNERA